MAAVQSGRLTRRRIQESVIKVLAAKEKVGLDRKRFVDLEAIGDIVDSPEANEKAQEIADRAVTLVRNGGNLVPLAAPGQGLLRGDAGEPVLHRGTGRSRRNSASERRGATGDQSDPVDVAQRMWTTGVGKADRRCDSYVVAAFASVSAYRGTVGAGRANCRTRSRA